MPRIIRSSESPFGGAVPNSTAVSIREPRARDGAWIETFLSAVMQGSTVVEAARVAGVHHTLPYKTRKTDEAFRRAWDEAGQIGTELLEQEAQRRAYHGTLRPVFYKGVECGFIKEYSDTLMLKLLAARKPEVYRERYEDAGGHNGNTVINVNVEMVRNRADLGGDTSPVIDVEVVGGGQKSAGVPETAQISHQPGADEGVRGWDWIREIVHRGFRPDNPV